MEIILSLLAGSAIGFISCALLIGVKETKYTEQAGRFFELNGQWFINLRERHPLGPFNSKEMAIKSFTGYLEELKKEE